MLADIAASRLLLLSSIIIALLCVSASLLARKQALNDVAWRQLKSSPGEHSVFVTFWVLGPASAIFGLYFLLAPVLADMFIWNLLRERLPGSERQLLSVFAEIIESYSRNKGLSNVLESETMAQMVELGDLKQDIRGGLKLLFSGLAVLAALIGAWIGMARLARTEGLRARVQSAFKGIFAAAALLSLVAALLLFATFAFETFRFFSKVSFFNVLLGTSWSPQTAIASSDPSHAFGTAPLLWGMFYTTFVALVVALPLGLGSGVYLSEYASDRTRAFMRPFLEVFSGLPTVVFGVFAVLTAAPIIRAIGDGIDQILMMVSLIDAPIINAQTFNVLSAGAVLGVMTAPFLAVMTSDMLSAAPARLRQGALAMGATRTEVVRTVIIPALAPGLVACVLLAISRALSETMIILMAAGHRAQVNLNPFLEMTTITVQIADLLSGEADFDSIISQAAYALGAFLLAATIVFNLAAQKLLNAYRRRHE